MTQLFWLRLIGGIGMGCIIPNATALIGEYSPEGRRVTLMMTITVGFTAGGAVAGFVARALIPQFGWQSVFLVGGVIPLVIAVAMLVSLPESLQFLAVRRRRLDQVARWLKQLDPTIKVDASTEYVANEESKEGVPAVHLFRDGRSTVTILLWIVNFMNLLNLYSVTTWLPTVVIGMGYNQNTALLVGTVIWVGGTIGTFGLAWAISRSGFTKILMVNYVLAAIAIALIGQPGISLALLTRHRLRHRMVRGRRSTRHERIRRNVLSHLSPVHGRGVGARHRACRRDRRAVYRRVDDRRQMDVAATVPGRCRSRGDLGGDAHDPREGRRRSSESGLAMVGPSWSLVGPSWHRGRCKQASRSVGAISAISGATGPVSFCVTFCLSR